MNRNETHEDAATTVPAITGVPVVGRGDGHCKRAGCGKPLPPGGRGRSREFCSDECRIRHYNAMRGQATVATPPSTGGPEAGLARLVQLLTESSRLAAAVSAQVAEAEPGRVAAVLAEAEAARRRAEATAATASAREAESAASASAAWESADAAENGLNAAQTRAGAAEEQAKNLQAKTDELGRELEAALLRAQAAERQAAEMTAERDAARQDSRHVEDVLAVERREAKEVAEQIRHQAARDLASAQFSYRAQADSARELASTTVARAERAEAALDAERTERRILTERLGAVSAQLARPRIRTTPRKQPRLP
jgi:hypothetical protein